MRPALLPHPINISAAIPTANNCFVFIYRPSLVSILSIDCCNRFVQCVDGVIHPPQVRSRPLAHQQDTAPGTNCKNREFVLASQCSSVSCPSELPDWGSDTGGSSGDDSSGSNPDNAGTDSVTGQFKLNATNHGK